MYLLMIVLPEPNKEVIVDFIHRHHFLAQHNLHLWQEAVLYSPEQTFQFPATLRAVRASMRKMDAKPAADALQMVGRINLSIVHICLFWQPKFKDRLFKTIF